MAPMRFGAVVGATMKTVSSEADRSQLATGSASSIGMSGTITPATPACAASAAKRRASWARIGFTYDISTTGAPTPDTSLASSRHPSMVMPCSSAVCPAFWITGPSANGSECGTPISSAATPEAARRFAISSDFFRVGCPAMMYTISFRSPSALSAFSRRLLVALNRVHVLVSAPRETHEDAPARTELPRQHAGVMKRMRWLERGHDPFEPRAELEGRDRVLVCDRDVLDALGVAQERVLRADPRIVEPCGDGMRGRDLPVAVLQQVRVGAVKNAGPTAHQRSRVLARLDARARGLHTDERHIAVLEERGEHA